MRMTCIKCGLVNPAASGEDDSCPRCQAIYSKAQPATAARVVTDGRVSGFGAMPVTSGGAGEYVKRLRANSQYPTFRSVASVLCFLGYLVGAVMIIGALMSGWKFGMNVALFSGLAAGLLIIVFVKAAKEASLMLADLSDATLRMAQRQEGDR